VQNVARDGQLYRLLYDCAELQDQRRRALVGYICRRNGHVCIGGIAKGSQLKEIAAGTRIVHGFFLAMRKRGLNVGWDTGVAVPILVPGITACAHPEPARYPIPTLDVLSHYGFAAVVEIEPHEWEKNKILRIVYPDGKGRCIYPATDFTPILQSIRRQAVARYGPQSVEN
jgi:hypothetical protein